MRSPCCELIKTNRVICDEILIGKITKNDVDLGVRLPQPIVVDDPSTIDITVVCCNVEVVEGEFVATVQLSVREELTITGGIPDETETITREYTFCETVEFTFQKCKPDSGCPAFDPEDLECQILSISGENEITFRNPPIAGNTLMDQDITVTLKMKIDELVQIYVTLCPPSQTGNVEIKQLPQ